MSAPQTRPRQLSNNQGQRPPAQVAPGQSHQSQAESDYVYFDRSTAGFTSEAVPKAKAAQLKLEHFYKVAVEAAVERNTRQVSFLLYRIYKDTLMTCMVGSRRVELERKLAADTTMSDERKQRQLQALGKKESTFLRLRRTKLGLDDFRTVKVIGKGAFGEVSQCAASILGIHSVSAGQVGAETRYREDLCHEVPT
jgi:protein-serine/threonine kinase